jgi:hypothetical protein
VKVATLTSQTFITQRHSQHFPRTGYENLTSFCQRTQHKSHLRTNQRLMNTANL